MAGTFTGTIAGIRRPSALTRFLLEDRAASEDIRFFLDQAFSSLQQREKDRFIKTLVSVNAAGGEPLEQSPEEPSAVDDAIHELVAFELLRRLGLQPEFHPTVGNKTPDLRFFSGGTCFTGDVYTGRAPKRSIGPWLEEDGPQGKIEWRESVDGPERGLNRSAKIEQALREKAVKYREIGPLVLFVFYSRHEIEHSHVEQALFGLPLRDLDGSERYPHQLPRIPRLAGLLLPDEGTIEPKHTGLSAVVGCDWFDTLDRSARGRRMHCRVFHHFEATSPLPHSAFGDVSQIIWQQDGSGGFVPKSVGIENLTIKFERDGSMRLAPYSSSLPF